MQKDLVYRLTCYPKELGKSGGFVQIDHRFKGVKETHYFRRHFLNDALKKGFFVYKLETFVVEHT